MQIYNADSNIIHIKVICESPRKYEAKRISKLYCANRDQTKLDVQRVAVSCCRVQGWFSFVPQCVCVCVDTYRVSPWETRGSLGSTRSTAAAVLRDLAKRYCSLYKQPMASKQSIVYNGKGDDRPAVDNRDLGRPPCDERRRRGTNPTKLQPQPTSTSCRRPICTTGQRPTAASPTQTKQPNPTEPNPTQLSGQENDDRAVCYAVQQLN